MSTPMTTRERRERRADRLREWADGREAKAEAAYEAAKQIADGIPFGQPILVGHYSEGRHRRDAARIESGMRATLEHSRKAEEMRRKAANIEAATERAIYDDDPDAVERLREKLANLEDQRARIKAYNESVRKGSPDISLLGADADGVTAEHLVRAGEPFPAYVLRNLGSNITRTRKRIEELSAPERPRWIVARFDSDCSECGGALEKGDRIAYFKRSRRAMCVPCGQSA